jgi:hypothetical protein
VNADEREEIAASVAAHADLGPRYDAALAEGLVERIGEEIDKRVDARLRGMGAPGQQPHQEPVPRKRSPGQQIVPPGYQGGPGGQSVQASQGTAQPPVAAHRGNGVTGMILGLGSMGLGVGATGIVASHHAVAFAQVVMILLIWAAIAIINIAYSQRR